MNRTRDNSETSHRTRRVGDVLSIPIVLAAAPTAGFLLGWFLDRRLRTFPWLTLALLAAGFLSGAREVWRAVKRLQTGQGQKRS